MAVRYGNATGIIELRTMHRVIQLHSIKCFTDYVMAIAVPCM